jgi:hypothetical protein
VHEFFREQTVNSIVIDKDTSSADLDRLAQIAQDVVALARAKGASASDVAASVDLGLSVGVRLGEVETVERTRDRGVSVTVYFGQRKGSATTADLDPKSIEQTVEHACAIARYTEADPANGLADPALLAKTIPDLDLWHPWDITPEEAIRLGGDRGSRTPFRCAHQQHRRRGRAGRRGHDRVRELERLHRHRARHASFAVGRADRRRRCRHAA